jgi:hypothetical protein
LSGPRLELDLLGSRFRIATPGPRWHAFLDELWGDFRTPPAPGADPVEVAERDGRTWLTLPGDSALPFDDPWVLAEVLRYWLVEHAVTRARGVVPLHAAALGRRGRGVLLAGPSGAGKTTLAVALAEAGWALASDDVAPIDAATGLVRPFPKPLSVRARATRAALAGRWRPDWPPRAPEATPLVVPASMFGRQVEPLAPAWLLFIAYGPDEPAGFEPLPGGRAAAMCIEYVRTSGEETVATLARLCRGVRAGHLRYRSTAEALELIEEQLANGQK